MMAPERLEALKFASAAIASFDPNGPGGFTLKHAQLRAGEILELVAEVQRLQDLLSGFNDRFGRSVLPNLSQPARPHSPIHLPRES